jgi:hypothetical protein
MPSDKFTPFIIESIQEVRVPDELARAKRDSEIARSQYRCDEESNRAKTPASSVNGIDQIKNCFSHSTHSASNFPRNIGAAPA